MTVAIAIKVSDGAVLACDSASSQVVQGPEGQVSIGRVYFNANKMINLHKRLPIGVQVWGSASIGLRSITLLLKDLRNQLMKPTNGGGLDVDSYTMEDVATRLCQFIRSEYERWPQAEEAAGAMGLQLVGYSANQRHIEMWQVEFATGKLIRDPHLIFDKGRFGIGYGGDVEALFRLYQGFSQKLPALLHHHLAAADPQAFGALINTIGKNTIANFVDPAMPIQDVIELSEFLVDVCIKFTRFNGNPPTISGPIEIATITQHEGFKWIKRKHYYDERYNKG